MLWLRLEPNYGYKKYSRVVDDVVEKYHPHGDVWYTLVRLADTLVRLAQIFLLRYPFIDGQGNFGSIDGDNAAATRYTEPRMTDLCTLLIDDTHKDTVDFRPTYNDFDLELVIMQGSFPHLLANGSEGIAVGMATNIPPHTVIGARRTSFEEVTLMNQVVDITALITKKPITIICSKMGWVRSLKRHNTDLSIIKYKKGDTE